VATNLVDPTFVLGLVGGTSAYLRLVAGGPVDIEAGAAEDAGSRHVHRASPEAALRVLAHSLRVDIDVLHGAGRGGPASWARALAAYVLVRRLGYRLTDVAGVLGRNLGTASAAVGEVGRRLREDEGVARQVERLVESLRESVETKVKA
jgi:chromosomal replication initiation ATPase DnaA